MKTRTPVFFLLVTAFFEGGAVMATEVLGAKFLSPYYGSSLLVWSGALGITLAGLAAGYFAGSTLSKREDSAKRLFASLIAGGILVTLMPFITSSIVASTLHTGLRTGIILSCASLLLLPIFCFGMVSPLIISSIAQGQAGSTTGSVYAISTAGGIVFTILTGFILIPSLGLTISAYSVGITTLIFPLVFFTSKMLTPSSR